MGNINWNHREFETNDLDKLLELRLSVFNESEYGKERWKWQYLESPMGKSFVDLAVDKSDTNKIAGHYAVVSYRCWVNSKNIHMAQSLDTFTSDEYRRQGIFNELALKCYDSAKDNGVEYVFGFPNQSSYPGFVKKLGFNDPFGFGIYKLPLRLSYYSKKILRSNLFSGIKLVKSGYDKRYSFKEIVEIPTDYNDILSEFNKLSYCQVVRSKSYLEWRYLSHPNKKYRIYELRKDNLLLGIIVLQFDEVSNFVHLVDFIVSDEIHFDMLLKSAIDIILKNKKINCISVFLNESNILDNYLKNLNFKYISKQTDFRFILKKLGSSEIDSNLLSAENWYITAGDTDFY